MAYRQTSGHLPYESASRTGHIPLIADPLVSQLLSEFQKSGSPPPQEGSCFPLNWQLSQGGNSGIETVIACDGSFSEAHHDSCDLVYIRAGIQRLPVHSPQTALHPFQMEQQILENSDCIQSVLPVDIPRLSLREFGIRMRRAIYETCASKPQILQTLRWLYMEGWLGWQKPLPLICCPNCGAPIDLSTQNELQCRCGEPIFLTDLLEWGRDIANQEGRVTLAGRFMLILEFLLLLTLIRETWEKRPEELKRTIFLHDGPLSFGGRYTQLISPMRSFLTFAAEQGYPVCLCGVEKTGRFANHLQALGMASPDHGLAYAVPTHGYIQKDVDGRSLSAGHSYGDRHLLGERVFVLLPGNRELILSIPSNLSKNELSRPVPEDLIGLRQILGTIPDLVTPIYDNALFPISRVNSLVSIAQQPCGHMLELFADTLLRGGKGSE